MLAYLLNVSMIWGLSLVLFQWLLRHETFHRWNRLYLLLSLAGGLLIPLLPGPESTAAAPTASYIVVPIRHFAAVKTEAVARMAEAAPTAPVHKQLSWVFWLQLIYVAGAAYALFRLEKELAQLLALSRKSKRSAYGGAVLLETGRQEGPYSFAHFIFISDRSHYSPDELKMILDHEQRHIALYHSVDLLLLRLLQVVFWFHPLIYCYRYSLQLVHEYQADAIARDEPTAYGTFLLEQTLLYHHNTLTHSFFHSPLKNRITMLTKNASSTVQLVRYSIVIPLLVVFLVACTRMDTKPEPQQKETAAKTITIKFHGNEIELIPERYVQTERRDPVNGTRSPISFKQCAFPLKVNGEKIYTAGLDVKPAFKKGDLQQYVISQTRNEFEKLDDGTYMLWVVGLVIDKQGKPAYHDNAMFTLIPPEGESYVTQIDSRDERRIQDAISRALFNKDAVFTPGMVQGQTVIATYEAPVSCPYKIVVKDHHMTATQKRGTNINMPELQALLDKNAWIFKQILPNQPPVIP